jgi:hypothetical protein
MATIVNPEQNKFLQQQNQEWRLDRQEELRYRARERAFSAALEIARSRLGVETARAQNIVKDAEVFETFLLTRAQSLIPGATRGAPMGMKEAVRTLFNEPSKRRRKRKRG